METIESYFDALASARPTPGGGSAATIVAAAGAALVGMVARLTLANDKYAEKRSLAERLVAGADRRRLELLEARDADERAYGLVVTAQAMPRATPQEKAARNSALQSALAGAASEPLAAAKLSLAVLELARDAAFLGNTHLASDVGCAAEFAAAGLAASAYNVRVNHRFLQDASLVDRQAVELELLEESASAFLAEVRAALR